MKTIDMKKILTKEEIKEYAGRSKKDLIAWAKREIEEYEKLLEFLEGK